MGKGRQIYFKDESLWTDLEKLAASDDRSINFVVERMVKQVLKSKKKAK